MTQKLLCLLAGALCVQPLCAHLAPKEAYQPIIDAKPFGEIAREATTDLATLAEEQKQKEAIAQKFRMCGITDMPDGTRKIAFLDETSGSVDSYLLAVGETQHGFTLVSADYDREYATLTKDNLTFTLGLGKGLIDQPPEEITPQPEVQLIDVRKPSVAAPAPALAGNKRLSFRQRLLQRQAKKAEAEESKRQEMVKHVASEAGEEVKTKLARRVQIERIKQGLAPTEPITLTPEEDAELEAAGAFAERVPAAEEAPTEEAQPLLQGLEQPENPE
ncbi:MAG: hypothetical protein ACI4RT_02650 [Candidatus Spyradenecus sp.]